MKLEDFDYYLPPKLIAQGPIKPRDASRLMVVKRKDGVIFHDTFRSLPLYLSRGDCLVANDTKVLPARLRGEKVGTKAKVEVLLLRKLNDNIWEVMVKRAKRIRENTRITFADGKLHALVKIPPEKGIAILEFFSDQDFYQVLREIGEIPLPPYIHRKLDDPALYQTIYARKEGAAAAPTAGLHFTSEIMSELKRSGIDIAFVTLNIGLDTFLPVRTKNIKDHKIHKEYFNVDSIAVEKINKAIKRGGRVVAVGTTTARALESAAGKTDGEQKCVEIKRGWTDLFIYPGYKFRIVDILLTNFHLPKSTLLMLVSAFAGRELVLKAYKEAIEKKYRFFSFGDCMIIL